MTTTPCTRRFAGWFIAAATLMVWFGVGSRTAEASQGTFSCLLTPSGGVKCWGYNANGSLGDGTVTQEPPYGKAIPVDVVGLGSGVAQVTVGYRHACALTYVGAVKCWGYNVFGQVGTGMLSTAEPLPKN